MTAGDATAWRIAMDARTYRADDLSGMGAQLSGGRWNDIGLPMVYCAGSRSLACLETMVHLNSGGLPLNRYLVEISIPAAVRAAAEQHGATKLEPGWDALPASITSMSFGSDWLRARRSAVLIVPSAIVPEEENFLINPLHPDAAAITARKVRRWTYDPRIGTV